MEELLPDVVYCVMVQVLAAGDPRPLPHVKYNQWVIDRRPLEALKAAAGEAACVWSACCLQRPVVSTDRAKPCQVSAQVSM